ncbi:MAG: WYL domain-containing protein, partial [Lachnospiraceae bacterium]|nr:WYL domain-containing protein [Lachnospiraceae bacterium]
APVQDIKLRFSQKRLQYVLTKPIHKSQKCSDPDNGIISLQLIPNRELESLILSFGPDVEVLEPLSLRNQIQEKVKESFSHYFDVQTGCTK